MLTSLLVTNNLLYNYLSNKQTGYASSSSQNICKNRWFRRLEKWYDLPSRQKTRLAHTVQAPGRLRTGWARRQPGTSPSFNIWTFLWLNKWRKTVTPIKSRWQTLKKFLMQFSQVCSLLKYYNSNNMQGLTPHIQYSI